MDRTTLLDPSLHVPSNPRTKPLKRNRKPLSCASCRVRKLKCNREHPCQNCIVRGDATLCLYAAKVRGDASGNSEPSHLGQAGLGKHKASGVVNADDILTEAESTKTRADEGDVSPVIGIVRIEKEGSSYRGSTHWDSVLQELSAFALTDVDESLPSREPNADVSPNGLYGVMLNSDISKYDNTDLVASLPSKPAADQLISRFFDPCGPAGPSLHIIHEPTFMMQYEQHWATPSSTPIPYLALLFSILGLSMQSYSTDEENSPYTGISRALATLYSSQSAQCIKQSSQSLLTLQATIFNSITGFSRLNQEDDDKMLSTIGSVVRTATRMGLHRDPSHFPNISPLMGEMRRRIWAFITQMDALSSFHLGIPSTIRSGDADTASPRHLYDTDLTEPMTELPPSRPPEQQIPIAYLIAKNHMLHVLGQIIEHLHTLHPGNETDTYTRVLKLDADLEHARSLKPPYLQLQSQPGPQPPPSPVLLTQRIQLELIYHQSICALHRKYLKPSLTNSTFSYSRRRCLSSSMALLSHQRSVFEGSQPGGLLVHARWYGIRPASDHFSLAGLILCLELQYRRDEKRQHGGSPNPLEYVREDTPTENEILDALAVSRDIWTQLSGTSTDAVRVARALDITLRSLERNLDLHPQCLPAVDAAATAPSWDESLYPLAIGGTGSSSPAPDLETEIPDLDWGIWDSLLAGQNSGFDDFDLYMDL